jgi:hypothetical protein
MEYCICTRVQFHSVPIPNDSQIMTKLPNYLYNDSDKSEALHRRCKCNITDDVGLTIQEN